MWVQGDKIIGGNQREMYVCVTFQLAFQILFSRYQYIIHMYYLLWIVSTYDLCV